MTQILATDLLSDFTRNNVEWLRRATARPASLSSEEWSQLAIVCEFIARLATSYRELVHACLERGIEAGTLKARLERSMAALGDTLRTFAELQQVGEGSGPDVRKALARIRNAAVEAEAVHADLAPLVALANAEPPPVPEAILAAAAAGPFVRLDEFRKRG